MTGTCIECKHWNLRDSEHKAIGFGRCAVDPEKSEALRAGRFPGPTCVCRFDLFKPATAATVARRRLELSL